MDLQEKFDLYLEMFKDKQDWDGFILTNKCDSLLFSCLAGCVEGIGLEPLHACDANGQWFRRPLDVYKECYDCGGSKSTISRDMLLGLAWYAWCNKRLDISEGVIKYALKNFGVMGKGPLSRTFIGPSLLATYAWISYKLGGPSRAWLRYTPAGSGSIKGVVDYQAHLQVLHYHLRSEVTGTRRDRQRAADIACKHSLRTEGKNLYFQYVFVGPQEKVYYSSKLNAMFPDDRLPQDDDRCSGWLWERDPGFAWQPGLDPDHQHTGGDFLWAAAWYLGKIKNVVHR